jgi:hypothetical protein
MTVAALYVERAGPYPGLVAEWFDQRRDARTYRGPGPVVAHPPCGPWSMLRAFCTLPEEQRQLAITAVDQVRTFGGVLEHPAHSTLWDYCHLPKPETLWADQYGGRSYQVLQGDYGHAAPKLTWLYAVRLGPCPFVSPTGYHPGGLVERMGKFARKATPHDFAEKLVAWAETASGEGRA